MPVERHRRRLVSVLAAAALVGVSAVTTWEVTRPASVTAPSAAERVAALSAPDGNRTLATVVERGADVHVVADGLNRSGDGRSFYLWGVPSDGSGAPQVLGTFRVTADGLHSYPVALTRAVGDYPVLAVSEEATGSSPTAPSSVLARGAVGH